MLPALCHIVSDADNDEYLNQLLLDHPFVSSSNYECSDMPNIIYSFKLANSMMIIDINTCEINKNTFWVHSKNEVGFNPKDIERLLCDIHSSSNTLEYEAVELVLSGWNVNEFLMKLTGPPIIYDGNYEIYIVNSLDGKTYSFQKDEMKYLDIDPKKFIEDLYNRLNFNFYVYDSIEIDNKYILNNINPIYIQDIIISNNIKYIDYIDIVNRYRLNKNIDKRYYLFLIYRVLQKMLLVKENSIEKQEIISHYKRSIKTIKAERIYSNAKLYFQSSIKQISPPIYNSLSEDNSLSVDYIARNKRTNRIFTKPNQVLNLLNLSNPSISDLAMTSSDDSIFISLDYESFEFSILSNIIDESIPTDLHSVVAEGLCIPRADAKILSAKVIYSKDERMLREVLSSLDKNQLKTYLNIIGEQYIQKTLKLKSSLEKEYKKQGYIINTYGRKIKPKSETAVLNSYIQSIASEIMIDLTCKLYDAGYKPIFQRFDAIFLELAKPHDKHREKLISMMETIVSSDIYTVHETSSANLTELIS
jgi:hypothetical protein